MNGLILDTQAVAKPQYNVSQLMTQVMLALLPGTLIYSWLISPGVLINIVVAMMSAAMLEALALACRKRKAVPALKDGSILLAAWLLALALPPSLPIWQLLIGVAAMTLLGKHLYGGLGQNPFNPAMVGYAVLLVSFPQSMTAWVVPAMATTPDTVLVALKSPEWDTITMATPLDQLRTANTRQSPPTAVIVKQFSTASAWVYVSLGFLAGGIYLLYRHVIRWHIPVSLLATLAALHVANNLLTSDYHMPLHISMLSGAAVLGAFFIATDPVSAAASDRGRLIYGSGIGVLTFVFREFSAYPEGIAFAVLLMNIAVPAIDYAMIPRQPRS